MRRWRSAKSGSRRGRRALPSWALQQLRQLALSPRRSRRQPKSHGQLEVPQQRLAMQQQQRASTSGCEQWRWAASPQRRWTGRCRWRGQLARWVGEGAVGAAEGHATRCIPPHRPADLGKQLSVEAGSRRALAPLPLGQYSWGRGTQAGGVLPSPRPAARLLPACPVLSRDSLAA